MIQYHQVPTITSFIKYQTVPPYSDQIPPIMDDVHGFTTFLWMTTLNSSPSNAQFGLLLLLFIAFFEDKFILFIAFVFTPHEDKYIGKCWRQNDLTTRRCRPDVP